MSSNYIDANIIKTKKKKETSYIEIELFITIIMDGLPDCGTQKTARSIYRGEQFTPINNTNLYNALSVYTISNPHAKPSKFENEPDDETHIHRDIHVDLKSYMFTPSQYNNTLKNTKRMISQIVDEYCVRKEIKGIKLHCFYLGYNTGDFLFNILHSFECEDEALLKTKLKSLFGDKKFLQNPKIKYKALESVLIVEPLGINNQLSSKVGAVITDKNVVTVQDDLYNRSFDVPLDEDVVDSTVLCQHTYYSQTDIQQSVWKWVKGIIKSIRNRNNNQKYTPGLNIKSDFDHNKSEWKDEGINYELIENTDKKWSVVNTPYVNSVTGFFAKLYKRKEPRGGIPVYAFCTCGTNFSSPMDWIFTNVLQGLIGISPQYTQSVRIAKQLNEELKDSILFFIGHSLGGGLASNNALVTRNRHAITFNAAGLSFLRVLGTLIINNPSDLFHVNERKSRVHAYVIEGEILNFLLGNDIVKVPYEKAYGNVTRVDSKIFEKLSRGKKHSMLNFLKLKETDIKQLCLI